MPPRVGTDAQRRPPCALTTALDDALNGGQSFYTGFTLRPPPEIGPMSRAHGKLPPPISAGVHISTIFVAED